MLVFVQYISPQYILSPFILPNIVQWMILESDFQVIRQSAGFCATVVPKYLCPIYFEVAKIATVDVPRE